MPDAVPSPARIIAAIADGVLTPAAAFETYAERIAASEPAIRAFAHLDVAAARAGVPAAALRGPLAGLPVGIKDVFDTADMPASYGTPLYAGHRPAGDAAVVSLVRRAGGSVVGKTTTTAFAFLDPTATANPRAPGRTPGGSSAGSAAAVAAGMVPFAVGSQTGGSTIRPASYCGVAALKPSFKLIPTVGLKTYAWNLDTVGLFAPRVRDLALFASAVTGRALTPGGSPPGAPRFGLLRVPDWSLAEPAMIAAVEGAARRIEAAGGRIVDIAPDPTLQAAWESHATLQDHEAYRALAFEFDTMRDRLPPLLRRALDAAADIDVEAYDEARGLANRARRAMGRLFETVDALLLPAAPGVAPEPSTTGQALFNRLITLTGDPAVAVPGALSPDGLPLGLQIVAPFGEDQRALALAAFVEDLIRPV